MAFRPTEIVRRAEWLLTGVDAGRAQNLRRIGTDYALGRGRSTGMPMGIKIDISPMCNLKCTMCIHEEPGEANQLHEQEFNGRRMSVTQYQSLVDECRGSVSAFSLYYFGDPFMHPQLDLMCRMTRDAGINVHLSSNFSFAFSDERIRQIVHSGVSHLTVCVDGFSQETYERTRRTGTLERVLHNLERLCAYKRDHGLTSPMVEVQYIKFNHNVHELPKARAWLEGLGVDRITEFWGLVSNVAELQPSRYQVKGPKERSRLPKCYWPYSGMVIKWNGDAVACCNFRQTAQYVEGADARPLGNVFTHGVRGVWNNAAYDQARRMSACPGKADAEPGVERHFCHACPSLYETTYGDVFRMAPKHDLDGR